MTPRSFDKRLILLIVIAFAAGAAVMVVELAAARILTPYFGQSVFVWTNVIGVILASIAAGNYLGGRIADATKSLKPLFFILVLAGALCLAIPGMIGWVSHFFLGKDLQLEEAFSLLVRGSFATTLLVFAPPVFLLGMALPFIVRQASEIYEGVGRASGSIYAASTLGSITGTFLTTYLFVELFGSKGTFYASGIFLIALAGLGFIVLGRLKEKGMGGVVVLAALCLGPLAPDRGFADDDSVLWETESRYQYLRVVQRDDDESIHLCINEGLDSFHSIYVKNEILTDGQYYDYYTLLPGLAQIDNPGKVCIIGLAAGTIARQYAHFFGPGGHLAIDGVEIDPEVVRAGYDYMDLALADPWMTLFSDVDGRVFLECSTTKYDVIVVDAYSQQIYIPFHLATEEFFLLLHNHLKEGGIFGINLSGFSRDEPVIAAIGNTAAKVFGSVSLSRIPDGRNFMLFAVKGKGHVSPSKMKSENSPSLLRPLLEKISVFGLTRPVVFDAAKLTLTDDHAPLELMSDRVLMARSNCLVESISENR